MQISHDPRLHDPDPGKNPQRKVAFLLEKTVSNEIPQFTACFNACIT